MHEAQQTAGRRDSPLTIAKPLAPPSSLVQLPRVGRAHIEAKVRALLHLAAKQLSALRVIH